MHLSRGALIAFCDGETGPAKQARVARHLAKCQKCSGELRHIRAEKGCLSSSETSGFPPGWSRLLFSMGAWRQGRTFGLSSEIRRRAHSQIEFYLGTPAVSLVEQAGTRAEDSLARATQILETLLGPEAAEAVRDRVLSGLECARTALESRL